MGSCPGNEVSLLLGLFSLKKKILVCGSKDVYIYYFKPMSLFLFYNCFYYFHIVVFIMVVVLFPLILSCNILDRVTIIYWNIVTLGNSSLDLPIIFDKFGIITSIVVLFISANVLRFAITYIAHENFNLRFIILVLLFVLSINLLIFIPNLIVLLIGWDGLGLIRFLLVIFYQNNKSLRAGIITALTNRLGDAILLLAIAWRLNSNNWNLINIWESRYSRLIIFSVIVAAITKSAQVPFSSWLPAAIAAPTPVSALVHSSTLVTAGVFLLTRFYNYISCFKYFEFIILFSACVTIFIAAFCAIFECDLKKIIALSTLRQLGVIITRLAIGLPNLALFHLLTHALFKALLFICAGNLIFLHGHNQDLRRVGNILYQLPIVRACFIIGRISLCGLPFLSGFYSKDLIIECILSREINFVIILIVIISTGGTALYSVRLCLIGLLGPSLSNCYHSVNNEDTNIFIPVFNLTVGAIIGGCLINWLLLPFGLELFISLHLKLIPLVITIRGGLIGVIINVGFNTNTTMLLNIPLVHDSFSSIWFLRPLSTQFILMFLNPAYYYLYIIDHGWVESLRAQGVFKEIRLVSVSLQPIQRKIINIIIRVSLLFILIFFINY